ncbi:MAG: pentapeptide repeat-containing protein [Deltaproteobacteria bacterium]|nr:pentapeptide repeat-containing protein [Deltaproteobacteria bacterium]
MSEAKPEGGDARFSERLKLARDIMDHLRRALTTHDEAAILMAASRLRIAVDMLRSTPATPAQLIALREVRSEVSPLLALAPSMLHGLLAVRQLLARVNVTSLDGCRRTRGGPVDIGGQLLEVITVEERDLTNAVLANACLRDVNLDEATLDGADASRVLLARVRLGAGSAQRIQLEDSFLEGCYLASANLTRSEWNGSTVCGSIFDGATMTDSRLDDAVFMGCSLRGVDFSSIHREPGTRIVGARFVRCDLRESTWWGRTFDRVNIIDCKVSGLAGITSLQGLTIERPDLSLSGDGSRIGRAQDVLRNGTAS